MNDPKQRKIGFVGLGAMGLGMANNLVRAGYDTTVYDVRPEPVAAAVQVGASAAASLAELGRTCDVVHVNVRTQEQVDEVLFGGPDGGIVGSARPGAVVLVHSTVLPDAVKAAAVRAAEHEVLLVDAPVVGGGMQAAIDGTLTMILAGEPGVVDQVKDLAEVLGSTTFSVGEVGMAQVAKIVNNVVAVANGVIIAEALALAGAAGLDEAVALDVLNAGSGASFLSAHRAALRAMVPESDMVAISGKDLAIALAHGKQVGVRMPVAALATQYTDRFLLC